MNYKLVAAKALWTLHAKRPAEKNGHHHFGKGQLTLITRHCTGDFVGSLLHRTGRNILGTHITFGMSWYSPRQFDSKWTDAAVMAGGVHGHFRMEVQLALPLPGTPPGSAEMLA